MQIARRAARETEVEAFQWPADAQSDSNCRRAAGMLAAAHPAGPRS